MLFRFAIRNVLRNKRRSFVTALTVAMGAGAIFMFHGFNTGVLNQYRENAIHARYGHGQVNTNGYREQVFPKPWEHWMDGGLSLSEKIGKLSGVRQVFPRVEFYALLMNGSISASGRGIGIIGAREANFFYTMNMEQGGPIGDTSDGIVLGVGLARALSVKVGDRVTVLGNTIRGSMNGLDLRVTGIFHTGARDIDDVLFQVQLAQASTLLDTDKVETVAIGLGSHEDWPAFAADLHKNFPALEATPFNVLDKIYYQQAVDWLGSQYEIIRLIILSIVLLGIFNTSSSAVLERTREIGTMRANGQTVGEIIKLLIIEGFAVSFVGALAGLLLVMLADVTVLRNGYAMPPGPGITRQFLIMLELQPSSFVQSLLLGIVAAIVANVLAGLKVAKMPISRALQ